MMDVFVVGDYQGTIFSVHTNEDIAIQALKDVYNSDEMDMVPFVTKIHLPTQEKQYGKFLYECPRCGEPYAIPLFAWNFHRERDDFLCENCLHKKKYIEITRIEYDNLQAFKAWYLDENWAVVHFLKHFLPIVKESSCPFCGKSLQAHQQAKIEHCPLSTLMWVNEGED